MPRGSFSPSVLIRLGFVKLLFAAVLASLAAPSGWSATFLVFNVNDAGDGSLRSAITNANASPGLDAIAFNIPGNGVHTISLLSALPALTDPVLLDGTTQPGYTNQPLIELDGTSAGGNSGLRIIASGGGTTIRGLAINRFGASGIQVNGSMNNTFQANFIGTDPSGTISRPNGQEGIYLNGSSSNLVGGLNPTTRNLISGNSDAGIYILNASGNTIQGNYIGTTESGTNALFNNNNGMIINGTGPGAVGNVVGGSAASGARNLISGNHSSGVFIIGAGAHGNLVQGNYIGTTADGTAALGNSGDGVTLQAASGNTIGSTGLPAAIQWNVISANGKAGISLSSGAATNGINANLIGTDASGTIPLGNTFAGVSLSGASSNSISGGNTIAWNSQDGVLLSTNCTGNSIQGNSIHGNLFNGISVNNANFNTIGGGLSAGLQTLSSNANYGLELFGGAIGNLVLGNTIVSNTSAGIFIANAPANTIGYSGSGGQVGTANRIFGNGDAGIYIVGPKAWGNQIQGNVIGTDGNTALGNALEGIYIESAPSNTIGGSLSGTPNLISGNGTRGIFLTNAPWTLIQGNQIGTKADRVTPLPNGAHNIECEAGTTNTAIGGSSLAGNTIAFAPGVYTGVRIRNGSFNNRILGNSIFGNSALGIDLGPAGVTPNDPCDTDTGANLLQNFPVVTAAVTGPVTAIRGTLNSTANTAFLLQFFANPACHSSGYGQGQIYLGDANVVTDSSCNASFVVTFPVTLAPGYVVTATATDPAGNTSEFSGCQALGPVPTLALSLAANHQASLSWTNAASGFVLKQTGSLVSPIQWTIVTNMPTLINGQFVVTLPIGATNNFFVLSFE